MFYARRLVAQSDHNKGGSRPSGVGLLTRCRLGQNGRSGLQGLEYKKQFFLRSGPVKAVQASAYRPILVFFSKGYIQK